MAEAVVSFAVETIGNLLIEEAKFLHGVSDQVQQLQAELSRMQSFLKDADARQHDEETVKQWISQARDLAYEADDLIERYAFKVASRRKKSVRSILKRCVCILKECHDSHTIGSDIQTLKAKISDLTKSLEEYGIREMMEREGGSSSSVQELRRTYSHVMEDDFVGLDKEVELIVEQLVTENENHRFKVVSLYGMGGWGKSTLANKVYNHSRVRRYFDDLVWVCISQKWKKEDILRQILTKLIPEKEIEIRKWGDEKLVRELFQIQQRKKYLLVLDDIWSVDVWESIRTAVPIREDGTKILLTTRNKNVAEQIDPNGFHHQPRLLSDDESWELLQMKTLRKRCQDREEAQKFEKLGKEMVKACGGLPLAVVVLGGTLATKKSLNEWEAVNKNIKAHLRMGNNLVQEQVINVHKMLALSYNDLPHKLKPCFLYLGRFDEDSDIDAETLCQLWIAEGMISTKDRIDEESMMDAAERYLGELVQRCMIQAKALEMPSVLNSFSSYRLHDLMRDLSLSKAEEENFLLSRRCDDGPDDGAYDDSSLTHRQLYRLVIRLSSKGVSKYVPSEKRTTGHLRSLALIIQDEYEGRMSRAMKSQFNQFKMLRVLVIKGLIPGDTPSFKESVHQVVDHLKLPKAIGKLIHLRYLSLSHSSFLCLPSSIGNLRHLETLDLRDAIVLRIPNVLWKLKKLRHLYLPKFWQEFKREVYCPGKLIKRCCKLRLDGLNKLEILENLHIPLCHIKDISKLKNLRALSVDIHLEFEDPTEIVRYILNSGHLQRKSIGLFSDYSGTTNEKLSIAVGQCFSCRNLQKLDVGGPTGNLPRYKSSFCLDLIELTLYQSCMTEDPMKTLEMLPNLRSLGLYDKSFMGKEMRCTGLGFRQLKDLFVVRLWNLEKWWVDDGAMPNLSCLTISGCEKLEMIPEGLRSITTLQELRIRRMPREFTEKIQVVVDGREGADFHKVSHIPSIIID